MPLFLKIVPSDFQTASRDQRELSVVQDLGHEIIVIAKGQSNNIKIIKNYTVHERSTRPLGDVMILIPFNRVISLIGWALYARRFRADFISCHDLIALLIGWLSSWALYSRRRPLLIYDSHEFEIGRNTSQKRSKLYGWIIKHLESFLMRRADLSMMVNNSIADEVQKIHKLPVRPLVIRNMASQWRIDPELCLEKRKELCDRLQLPISTFLIMYHGGILRDRGIENLIQASARIDNVAIVILGNGESGYKQEIKTLANNVGFTHKLLFLDAVPIAALWQFVGAVDVGSVLIQNTCQSYYYSLPNKLFENVQAETPIIGSNFPEIERVVNQYKIGLCCDSGNVDDIINVINRIKNNNILYNELKYNIKLAKSELSWEKEKMILSNIYEKEFTKYQFRSNLNIRG